MEDLRVIKTKSAIKGAFIELVEEKGFDHVSVKDICNKALINRNTFYLHYVDKIDLLSKIVSETFVNQTTSISSLEIKTAYNDKDAIKKAFIATLNAFYKDIEFYRIILLDSNMSGYVDKYAYSLTKEIAKIYDVEYQKNKIQVDFIFSGIVGVIKNWIIKDYASIDELASLLTDITIINTRLFN